MINFFIFHGTGGHPEENWFPWMKEQLQQYDYSVTIPVFPTPEGQSYETWLNTLNQYKEQITPETILIGYSLGGLFLLRVLEQLNHSIRMAVFVGTPIGIQLIKNYAADQSFSHGGFEFDWKKIKCTAQQSIVFHSDTDPYVSLGNGEALAEHLGTKLTFVSNAGHFNAAAGYTEFPMLLELIEKNLKDYTNTI